MSNSCINIKMPAQNTTLIEWLKSIGENLIVFTAPFIVIIWKSFEFLNKRTEAQTRRDREFIKEVASEVVKQVLDSTLPDIHRNIQEMKKDTHESLQKINDRIDDVILNVKK